jgi:hypothetical protein
MRKDPHKHTDQEEPFLTRWSRKKSGADDSEAHRSVESLQPSPLKGELEVQESTDNAPLLTDADMPPVDSLDEKSDYSGFMSEGVSEQLRQLALRKLFRSAGFNVRDGLDDYDDDFTNFAALGDIITADMKHQMEMAEKRKREKEEEEANLQQEQSAEEVVEEVAEENTEQDSEEDSEEENSGDRKVAEESNQADPSADDQEPDDSRLT